MVTQPLAIFSVCKIRFPILFNLRTVTDYIYYRSTVIKSKLNSSDAYVSLNTRLENIVGRMEDKFGEDCAIHVPPKQQDNEIEQVSLSQKTEFVLISTVRLKRNFINLNFNYRNLLTPKKEIRAARAVRMLWLV